MGYHVSRFKTHIIFFPFCFVFLSCILYLISLFFPLFKVNLMVRDGFFWDLLPVSFDCV